MKTMVLVVMAALGLAAMMVGYGSFGALGQSVQPGPWQLISNYPTLPGFAWKLNTATGDAYLCQGAQKQCVRMHDEP